MRPHTSEAVRLSTMPLATRHGYSHQRTRASFYRSRLAIVIGSYLVLDVCAVLMTSDPHFVIGPAPSRHVPWSEQTEHFPYPAMGDVRPDPPSPALFAIPSHLEMLHRHPHWLDIYRSLLGLAGMLAALQIVLNIDQLARVFFGNLLSGPKSMSTVSTASQLWHYPSAFGSAWQIMDQGLHGFWGAFWHQTFREGFCAPTQWLIDRGLLSAGHEVDSDGDEAVSGKFREDPNGPSNNARDTKYTKDTKDTKDTKGVPCVNGKKGAVSTGLRKRTAMPWTTRCVGLALAFGQSAILHSAASLTTLPTHTWWQGPALFFLLASVGIAVQSVVMPASLLDRLPHRVRQTINVIFALGWLHATAWLFIDDQARSGIWLFEPVPFSPTRFIMFLFKGGEMPPIVSPGGSNRAGHSAWRWYHDDFIHWYTGKHWWDTGIAL